MSTNRLTCQACVDLATEYLEDALIPPAWTRFEDHLAACAGCSTYVVQLRHTVQAIGRLAEPGIDRDAEQRLRRSFASWKARRQKPTLEREEA